MPQTLREVMTTNVETVSMQDDLTTVAIKMRDSDVGVIPVVDEQQMCVGLVTDRDIVIRGVASGTTDMKVQDIATSNVISVSPDTGVSEAADLMAREQVKRLPVVEGGKLVGIVALADLAREEQTQDLAGYAVSEISETEHEHSRGQQ